jgi:glycosyltransferase involved in cell wall biosynthesis
MCATASGAYWMVQIAAGLVDRGYEVVAFIGGEDGDTARNCRRFGIPYVVIGHLHLHTRNRFAETVGRIPLLGRMRPLFDVAAVASASVKVAWKLRRNRIDICHTHTFNTMIIGRLAATIARVPIRVTMVPGPFHLESEILTRMDLVTSRLEHRLIGGSKAVERLYAEAGVPPSRRDYVPYGADPADRNPGTADRARVRREFGLAGDTPLVGQIAYFYPVLENAAVPPKLRGRGIKGHEDVVLAARTVLERHPTARFMLVGDGWGPDGERHRDAIRQLCHETGVAHAFIFPGQRPDVADLLAAFDVSLQPSLSENYGGTVESLLMERPTVGTDTGGIPEVVLHEQTGLLVPPGDPRALAAAIGRLIDDPELGRRLGEAGRRHILSGWTTAHSVAGVDRVYRELADGRRVRRPPMLAR